MGTGSSRHQGSRQREFQKVIEGFYTSKIDKIVGHGTFQGDDGKAPNIGSGPLQMCTGRISATDGILTSPVSNAPCVAYHLEISERCFTGDNISNYGVGYKCIYSEKKSVAFKLLDSRYPSRSVRVGAYGDLDIYDLDLSNNQQRLESPTIDLLTDVVVAHICPGGMEYDLPNVKYGEIQATEAVIRGYPMRFGMLDGEGEGSRAEIPENIEELFSKNNIKRRKLTMKAKVLACCGRGATDGIVQPGAATGSTGSQKGSGSAAAVADVEENAGAGAGEGEDGENKSDAGQEGEEGDLYQEKTFAVCEMTLRVNDQVSVVSCFQDDPNDPGLKHAVPIPRQYDQIADNLPPEGVGSLRKLTHSRPAVIISKFPKIGHVPPLERADIWDQEEGVLDQFKLAGDAHRQRENRDFAAASSMSLSNSRSHDPNDPLLASGDLNRSGSRPGTGAGKMSSSHYLFSEGAKERLAARGVVFDSKPSSPMKAIRVGLSMSEEKDEDDEAVPFDVDRDAGTLLLP